jgi:hypothetical protein
MKISIEQYGVKVTVEVDHDDQNMYEMLEHFKSALLALTYQEGSWKDVIQTLADEYNYEWDDEDDDTDNVPEELPEPIHVRSEYC